jgi:hypothetical protein
MVLHYTVDDQGEPVPCEDLLTWARWLEDDNHRIVAQEIVAGFKVSTVFLGVDHGLHGHGPPILWETMIFGPDHKTAFDGYQERYTSRREALEGHDAAVKMVLRETARG